MSSKRPLPSPRDTGPLGIAYAYVYLTVLIVALLAGTYHAAHVGLIATDVTVTVHASLGWVVEWLLAGLVVLFLLWTFAQVVRATGGRFVSGVVNRVASIADSYQLPATNTEGDDQ